MVASELIEEFTLTLGRCLGRHVERDPTPNGLEGLDLVGGVVTMRGAFWGLLILRCERDIVSEIAAPVIGGVDDVLRGLLRELGLVVLARIDPLASLGPAVALSRENADWQPDTIELKTRARLRVAHRKCRVELYRRRRPAEIIRLHEH